MKIVSLFSGCGGLDLGFKKAEFDVIWANEYDQSIWNTYEKNHKNTFLDKRSIIKIPSAEIPDCLGVIGGPPCQSWSHAGKGLGFKDARGRLFHEFIRVINDKKPLFFVAENVEGMLSKRHGNSVEEIKKLFQEAGDGYEVSMAILNASDYNVPQNRLRVFFVGYAKSLNLTFEFPKPSKTKSIVKDWIEHLQDSALPALPANHSNKEKCSVPNHEYWLDTYSYIFMSRNRVLSWDKPSYTIQASGRQTPIHPKAPKMVKVKKDVMKFAEDKEHLYRRLSVRECAQIQTFPSDFIFQYERLESAYKMIGNAVPVNLANAIAEKIFNDLFKNKGNYPFSLESKVPLFCTRRNSDLSLILKIPVCNKKESETEYYISIDNL